MIVMFDSFCGLIADALDVAYAVPVGTPVNFIGEFLKNLLAQAV